MSKYYQKLSLFIIAVLSILIISCGKDKPKESDTQNDKESMGAIGEYTLFIQKNYSLKKEEIKLKGDTSGFASIINFISFIDNYPLSNNDLIISLIQKTAKQINKSAINTSVNIDNIDYNSKVCCFKSSDEAEKFYQKLFNSGLVLEQYKIEKIAK